MSYKVSFLDNQVCGVDDFNAVLGDIAREGVVTNDFDKTSAYQMSKMNVVTKNIISQGVSEKETSLSCSIGMKDGENGVYIAPGLGIFGSGARIKVEASEFVSFGDNTDAYIYAYHDVKNNMAGFLCAGDGFPAEVTDELYVLQLCQIVGGVFTDKREYAKARVKVCDICGTVQKHLMTTPTKAEDGQEIEIPVGNGRLNFLCFCAKTFTDNKGSYHYTIIEEPEYGVFKVTNRTEDGEKAYLTVRSQSGSVADVFLKDFRRGTNGELLATVVSSGSGSTGYEYVMYSSCYEEVSE